MNQEFARYKFSNAYSTIDFKNGVSRDKVSFISQLCKQQIEDDKQKQIRQIERRRAYMDALAKERMAMDPDQRQKLMKEDKI